MNAQLNIRTHPEVDNTVKALPQCPIDSLELFKQRQEGNGDLSAFINTQPFSPKDAVGKRTRIEHYHLLPCQPVCYLVGLVRSVNTIYILDVFEHPPQGTFASREIEERLYSRLSDLCPELAEYKLPGTYRSGLPVDKKDMYRTRSVNGIPCVAPVRVSNSDYLPLGQLTDFPDGQTRVAIVVGTFVIPREDIPNEAIDCIDSDEHPERESLTLYIGGWVCHSGIYRKETEQLILWLCPLHNVIVGASNREPPAVVALEEQDYRRLVELLRSNFAHSPPLLELQETVLHQMPQLVQLALSAMGSKGSGSGRSGGGCSSSPRSPGADPARGRRCWMKRRLSWAGRPVLPLPPGRAPVRRRYRWWIS